jgi:hypothetical protein
MAKADAHGSISLAAAGWKSMRHSASPADGEATEMTQVARIDSRPRRWRTQAIEGSPRNEHLCFAR